MQVKVKVNSRAQTCLTSILQMSALLTALSFAFGVNAPAQTVGEIVTPAPKSSVEEMTKDFMMACEMSKLAVNLTKTPAFKDDPADLSYRVSELMSAAIRTHEVKDAYKAIVQAKPEERVKLWHETARQNGVKDFKCKTIGFR